MRRIPLLLVVLAGACSTPVIDVAPQAGRLSIDGDIGIGSQSVSGTSSTSALGLETDDFVPEVRVDVDWDMPHLTVSGLWSDNSGQGALQAPMSQGGVTIPSGTSVDSEFQLGLYEGVITWDFVPDDSIEAGVGFGLALIDLQSGFTSLANGDEIFTDETLPVPLLSGRLGWTWERVELSALVSGVGIDYGGEQASFLDADLRVDVRVLGRENRTQGLITAGWRFLSSSLDYDNDTEAVDANIRMNGPYVGLVLRF
jgi:hypothetical protein